MAKLIVAFRNFANEPINTKEWKNFTQFVLGAVFQRIYSTLYMGLNNEN